jgi:hypothetical protein
MRGWLYDGCDLDCTTGIFRAMDDGHQVNGFDIGINIMQGWVSILALVRCRMPDAGHSSRGLQLLDWDRPKYWGAHISAHTRPLCLANRPPKAAPEHCRVRAR